MGGLGHGLLAVCRTALPSMARRYKYALHLQLGTEHHPDSQSSFLTLSSTQLLGVPGDGFFSAAQYRASTPCTPIRLCTAPLFAVWQAARLPVRGAHPLMGHPLHILMVHQIQVLTVLAVLAVVPLSNVTILRMPSVRST